MIEEEIIKVRLRITTWNIDKDNGTGNKCPLIPFQPFKFCLSLLGKRIH
jgi:hypothetical protein